MIRGCLALRSTLERRLIFAIVALSVLLVGFVISLIVVVLPKNASSDEEKRVCETERCKAAGEYVLSSIDRTSDPCQDFYSFACNGWKSGHNSSVEVTTLLSNDARQAAIAILCDTQLAKDGPKSLKNAINFYGMCNNATKINRRGLNPIRKSLNDLGGWPALEDNWISDGYDWMAAEAMVFLWTRQSIFAGFVVVTDPRNGSSNVVQLGFLSTRANTNSVEYHDSIRNVLSYFDDRKDYEQDIRDIVGLENDLLEVYDATQEQLTNMTVAELTEETGLNWETYLQLLTNGTSVSLTNDSVIVTDKLNYLKALGDILQQNSSRRIANMLAWKFLSFNWFVLPDALIGQFEPRIDLPLIRRNSCFNLVESTFRVILSHVYIKKNFQIPTKDKSQRLMEILLKEFLKMIEVTDWLDDQTKALAVQKAQAIKFYSAFPDWLIDAAAVEENYSHMREIDADGEDVLEAFLMLNKFYVTNLISAITNSRGFFRNPFEVNASYKRTTNEFAVSAAMLRPPFYHDQNPWYLNIGALGSVIGHEITHAFDREGRQYNEASIRQDWWNETTVEEFQRRAACFDNQYQKYGVTGFSNKRSEIIADNGGIRIAFKTYQNLEPKEDLLLPGFEDFTRDQLFFIAFGMIYCSNGDTEEAVSEEFTYPPKRLRVNIPLQNMQEFADAFSCDWSSSMNPREKCILW